MLHGCATSSRPESGFQCRNILESELHDAIDRQLVVAARLPLDLFTPDNDVLPVPCHAGHLTNEIAMDRPFPGEIVFTQFGASLEYGHALGPCLSRQYARNSSMVQSGFWRSSPIRTFICDPSSNDASFGREDGAARNASPQRRTHHRSITSRPSRNIFFQRALSARM